MSGITKILIFIITTWVQNDVTITETDKVIFSLPLQF